MSIEHVEGRRWREMLELGPGKMALGGLEGKQLGTVDPAGTGDRE